MSADSDALHTVQQLPGLTPGEQQYLLTVARGEGLEIKEEATENKTDLMLTEETWKHLKASMAIAGQGITVQFDPEINDLYMRLLSKVARAERVEKPEQSA